jgi:SAM-dependent methyltransferase
MTPMGVQDRYREYQPDQREFFDALITEDWDSYRSPKWDAMRRYEVERLFHYIRPRTVLDVGCGCGFHDAEMAERAGVMRVDGIDYSSRSIEQAEKHYPHPKVRRWVQDIATYRPEAPYDLVVGFQVIEHIPDATEFLRACARCATPEGYVAAFSVHLMRPYNRRRMHAGKAPELEDPMHCCEFTAETLRQTALDAGLAPLHIFHYMAENPKWPIPIRLRLGAWFPSLSIRIGGVFRVSN